MADLRGLEATGGLARRADYKGREHVVVPVIALVEGVVHAMNASGPELVLADEFLPSLKAWDGKPIFLGHPLVNGRPVSGQTPSVRDLAIGHVRNPRVEGKKLLLEAWIDAALADDFDTELLSRIEQDEPIEISVGAFVETLQAEGVYNDKAYTGQWHNLLPDHLALLPEGTEGACSREMGCGIRAAIQKQEEAMYEDWLTEGPETTEMLRTLRNIPMSVRDKMPAADFAGPNKSFPIEKPVDVHDAARAVGRAKGNPDAVKAKVISIAYRKGTQFVAQLPDDWKKKKDQKNASVFARMMSAFRDAVMNSGEMSDSDIRSTLREALALKEPAMQNGMGDITDVYADKFVYCLYGNGEMEYYERPFTMDDHGAVTLGDPSNVERVVSYEPVAATAQPCGCHNKEIDMTKAEITKYLETATEDQLKALSAVAKPPTAEEIKAAADAKTAADLKIANDKKAATVEAIKATGKNDRTDAALAALSQEALDAMLKDLSAPKAPTFDELLAAAPGDVRESINAGVKAAAERKTASIKTLRDSKRCDLTDQELKAMSQSQLDNLVKLADLKTAAVDFSGQGTVRVEGDAKPVQAPVDMNARILERNSKGKK